MPRRNRNAWRNDQARSAETRHAGNLVDLNQRQPKRGKRGRRLQQKRAA